MRKLFAAIFIIAALAVGAGLIVQAQTPPVQAVQAGPFKIGFINVHRVVNESDRGKALNDKLQDEINAAKTKLETKKKEVTNLQAALTANKDKWDLATKQAKAAEIEQKMKAVNRDAEDYQDYYQKREDEQIKPIIDSLDSVITDMGKKEGFSAIFDVTGAILYINPSLEITDKVIKTFNQKK
jgi:outer membrane protein